MNFLSLDPILRQAIQEDLGRGDITTDAILQTNAGTDRVTTAQILARENLVLAGWPLFVHVFELLGPVQSLANYEEGDWVNSDCIGTVEGKISVLLKAERVALNFLQRLCGIATLTREYVELLTPTKVQLLDTRKTTPLWRSIEKYAVRMGGGQNHRMGLDDGILIKENHITAAGGVLQAVLACRKRCSHLQKIQVEVTTEKELALAVEAQADIILLDNMSPEETQRAVSFCAGRCLLEISGGISQQNLMTYAKTGVDFISVGALTHSVPSINISMLLDQN